MGYFQVGAGELEEAAAGGRLQSRHGAIRVVSPVCLPALVVVTFFSFTRAWNEFLYAYVFTSTNQARTITAAGQLH